MSSFDDDYSYDYSYTESFVSVPTMMRCSFSPSGVLRCVTRHTVDDLVKSSNGSACTRVRTVHPDVRIQLGKIIELSWIESDTTPGPSSFSLQPRTVIVPRAHRVLFALVLLLLLLFLRGAL